MRKTLLLLVAVGMAAALIVAGCSRKDDPVAEEQPEPQEAPSEEAEEEAEEEVDQKLEDEEAEAAAQPLVPAARTVVNKEMLAKAYEEIYCAQKRGETDEILDIYKRYGFDTPKAWTEAWSRTSEDAEWQEALTRRVQSSKCE